MLGDDGYLEDSFVQVYGQVKLFAFVTAKKIEATFFLGIFLLFLSFIEYSSKFPQGSYFNESHS